MTRKRPLGLGEMFWGERYGIVRDPFGHHWALCTRREMLGPDEVAERVPAEPTEDSRQTTDLG